MIANVNERAFQERVMASTRSTLKVYFRVEYENGQIKFTTDPNEYSNLFLTVKNGIVEAWVCTVDDFTDIRYSIYKKENVI